MAKKKRKKFGEKPRQNSRLALFDQRADENLVLVQRYMVKKIGDPGLAHIVGLNGGAAPLAPVMAYAIDHWARAIESGEQDDLGDLKRWGDDYVAMAFGQPEVPKRERRIWMTVEEHDQAVRIYEYLRDYPGLNLTYLKAINGGISWRVIYWLALERFGQYVRREHAELV